MHGIGLKPEKKSVPNYTMGSLYDFREALLSQFEVSGNIASFNKFWSLHSLHASGYNFYSEDKTHVFAHFDLFQESTT